MVNIFVIVGKTFILGAQKNPQVLVEKYENDFLILHCYLLCKYYKKGGFFGKKREHFFYLMMLFLYIFSVG